MSVAILTHDDLQQLKHEILDAIRASIERRPEEPKKWAKASEIKKLLGISLGTLSILRKDRTLKYWTDGYVILYDYEHIKMLLEKGSKD